MEGIWYTHILNVALEQAVSTFMNTLAHKEKILMEKYIYAYTLLGLNESGIMECVRGIFS